MKASDSFDGSARSPRVSTVAWLLIVIAVGLAFYRNFVAMWARWFPAWRRTELGLYDRFIEGSSYYTHGPIIPVLSLLIAVLIIRHIKISVRPNWKWGGLVLGGSLLLHLMASLARVNFVSGFAFVGVIAGLVLVLWGTSALRQLWFPIVLLCFMVPLPDVTITQLNFRLKEIASEWGVRLANAVGIIAERNGNRVFLDEGKELVVANVCNGLRTLISLLAFGAMYTYVCRLRGAWRLGLFAMTIPVAVVCNAVRIVSVIAVADFWTVEKATGWFHDTSGILIFVMAFLLMFSIERFVLWAREVAGHPAKIVPLFEGRHKGLDDCDQFTVMMAAPGRSALVFGLIILAAGGYSLWLGRAQVSTLTTDKLSDAVSTTLTVGGRDMYGRDMVLDDDTLMTLEYPSYLYRRYTYPGVEPLYFCVIYSKDNRKGTHPPDQCLEGSGQGIAEKDDFVIENVQGCGDVPCRELVVQGQAGGRDMYYVYTYKCGKTYTRSFWVQQFVIFASGLVGDSTGGALVRVSTPITTTRADARERATAMLRAALTPLNNNLKN